MIHASSSNAMLPLHEFSKQRMEAPSGWRPVFFLVKLDGTLLKTNMAMENQPFWIKREFAPENKPRLPPPSPPPQRENGIIF